MQSASPAAPTPSAQTQPTDPHQHEYNTLLERASKHQSDVKRKEAELSLLRQKVTGLGTSINQLQAHGGQPQGNPQLDQLNKEKAALEGKIKNLTGELDYYQASLNKTLRQIFLLSVEHHLLPPQNHSLFAPISQRVMQQIFDDFETKSSAYNNLMNAYLKKSQMLREHPDNADKEALKQQVEALEAQLNQLVAEKNGLVDQYIKISDNLLARLIAAVDQQEKPKTTQETSSSSTPAPILQTVAHFDQADSLRFAQELIARINTSPRLIAKILNRAGLNDVARINQWLGANLPRGELMRVLRHMIHENIQMAAETRIRNPDAAINVFRGHSISDSLPGEYQNRCLSGLLSPSILKLQHICDAQPIELDTVQGSQEIAAHQQRLLELLENTLKRVREEIRTCLTTANPKGEARNNKHALERLIQMTSFLHCDLAKYGFQNQARIQIGCMLFLRFVNPSLIGKMDESVTQQQRKNRILLTKALQVIVNQEDSTAPWLAFLARGTPHNIRLYQIVDEIITMLLPATAVAEALALMEQEFPDLKLTVPQNP